MDFEHSYDHLAVSAIESPFGLLADARAKCPVAHSDQYGGHWTLFRYEDISETARQPHPFVSSQGASLPHHGFPVAVPPIEIDPPDHIKYRTPLLGRFSPGAMARLEPEIRDRVTQLIDAFIEAGAADLVPALCVPLPAGIITNLLAIPDEDHARFHELATRCFAVQNDFAAVFEVLEFFMRLHDDRLANPRDPADDIPTLLHSIEVNGEPIGQMNYVVLMSELLLAGLDTTANAAAYMFELLAARPDLRQALLDDPGLAPTAIEEFLRYTSPLPASCRTTTEEVTVADQVIPKDAKVQLNWMAANHDPEEFDEPEEVRLDRSPNRHLTFGAGPHRCLGSHLARLELRVVLEEVLRRMPDYDVGPGTVQRQPGIIRTITTLPVTFTPGPRAGV